MYNMKHGKSRTRLYHVWSSMLARLHRGWNVERVLTQPMRGKNGRGS